MQAPFELSNQLNKQVTNIYNVIISNQQTQKIWYISQSRWLTDSISCTISMTISLSQLTLEADPNKIPLKIWFNMSTQNQIKDFPQNSCRANNSSNYEHGQFYNIEPLQDLHTVKGTIMKIRSMQTCIMSSLPRCIFRCSVFRYVTLDIFFPNFVI